MTRATHARLQFAVALTVALVLGMVLSSAFGKSEVAPTVVRKALAQSEQVQGAPGRTLALSKVVIEPGAKIALHHHLGTQVARVQAGVLTYTVEQGAVPVYRGASDAEPTLVRSIAGGQTGRVNAGQWLIEQPSDYHRAANNGSTPVVIYLSTLLKTGAPPSTPVSEPPSGK